jgi:hypothetical protein
MTNALTGKDIDNEKRQSQRTSAILLTECITVIFTLNILLIFAHIHYHQIEDFSGVREIKGFSFKLQHGTQHLT